MKATQKKGRPSLRSGLNKLITLSGFSDLASKPLGIWTWSINDKSWQWAWSTLGQNFVKIHALGAELRRFLCDQRTNFIGKRLVFLI